jgi:pSer/pThr/pTyr-binding forkhead associated (FHA) protein
VNRSFALKFISGKYQGGEFPVAQDHDLIVGRASEFDMVLVEDMVSRKHATIRAANGELTIEDLGSTNGTFVNGERIATLTQLKAGDRILIGTSILKVITPKKGEASAHETPAPAPTVSASSEEISGLLDEVRVPDLLALLNSAKKTGVLETQRGDDKGQIYVRDGNIFYATINGDHDMGPHKALARLIDWDSGRYDFGVLDEDINFVFELEEPLSSLVSVAQNTSKQYHAVEDSLPPFDSDLSLAKPMEGNLSDLDAAELDILQLIHNHGRVQQVLDEAITNDPTTAGIIIGLITKKFIVIF